MNCTDKTIVIVGAHARTLAEAVKDSGYTIHTAENARDAVELINALRPSVLTVEDRLPGIDGPEGKYGIGLAKACWLVMKETRIIGIRKNPPNDLDKYSHAIVIRKGYYHPAFKHALEHINDTEKPVS